jgi:hypothetical protein
VKVIQGGKHMKKSLIELIKFILYFTIVFAMLSLKKVYSLSFVMYMSITIPVMLLAGYLIDKFIKVRK